MASAKERSNSPDLTIEDDFETRNNGKRLILIDRERSPSAKKRKIEQSDCAFDSDLVFFVIIYQQSFVICYRQIYSFSIASCTFQWHLFASEWIMGSLQQISN